MFGAIGDSAPDRWGRALMRRAERRRAEKEGVAPRALREIEYLLRVDDEVRQGALRFRESEDGPFLAPKGGMKIPPLVELPRLLSAAERLAEETEDEEDLRLLLAPGSSLGGARPKASVRDSDGSLALAKFPHRDDGITLVLWEALALSLARKAGLAVPEWRVENAAGKAVLLLRRFDRHGSTRIPFLSAMTMLGAGDGEPRSYLEIADAIRRHGAAPMADLRTLWMRIVFNILVSNTDDHLRNHGFLYESRNGWRLSPAYDLNPVPTDVKPRILTTAIDESDGTASLELALSVAAYFELDRAEAVRIAAAIGRAVSGWRMDADALAIPSKEISRMKSAFEHKDLEAARSLG
jgi:serine/threonine-protein kinase HipA